MFTQSSVVAPKLTCANPPGQLPVYGAVNAPFAFSRKQMSLSLVTLPSSWKTSNGSSTPLAPNAARGAPKTRAIASRLQIRRILLPNLALQLIYLLLGNPG